MGHITHSQLALHTPYCQVSAQGDDNIPKETWAIAPEPRSSGHSYPAVCVPLSHSTCYPLPGCPVNTNTHLSFYPVPISKTSTLPSVTTPSPHPLGTGCEASVLRGFGGGELWVPKWAQWEGRSHMLRSSFLMRPQLQPSHTVPHLLLILLAWQPSPQLHTLPISQALLWTTPTHHCPRRFGSSLEAGGAHSWALGWQCPTEGI